MAKRLVLVFFGAMLLVSMGLAGSSYAGINLNIGIGVPAGPPPPPPAAVYPAPPPVGVVAPPYVAVIPGTYVYYAPYGDVDLFFYNGFWWRPYHGRWFRSAYYGGPWRFVRADRVPRMVVALPPGWRDRRAGFERIPYGRFNGNWRRWQRERHWDRGDHDRGRDRDHRDDR